MAWALLGTTGARADALGIARGQRVYRRGWPCATDPIYVAGHPDLWRSPAMRAVANTVTLAIAAASIVAKVTRDRLMEAHHQTYPHYNFLSHKGYGTEEHLQRLAQHGPCAIHRRTFAPVARPLRGSGESPRPIA